MKSDKSSLEIIESVKELFTQLSTVNNGRSAIQYLRLSRHGSGQTGFDLLKNEFNELDLSKLMESIDLDAKIKSQQEALRDLERSYTDIKEIIGDTIDGKTGSIANQILDNLNNEVKYLQVKRDELLLETNRKEVEFAERVNSEKEKEEELIKSYKDKVNAAEESFNRNISELEKIHKARVEEFDSKNTEFSARLRHFNLQCDSKIREAEDNASQKVKLINQFKDFLEETNENMKLYERVIMGVLFIAVVSIGFSIPNLLTIFESYDAFIQSHNSKITNWQIINYAIGLLIVKLPWALCLSAVLTGMYSLLKGLLMTYEKINQDKRNMSAIYSISGNAAQALNEYGIDLANLDYEDGVTEEPFTTIRISPKELMKKRESFRWNQIMRYFEGIQHVKEVADQPEDETKLKLLTGLLNRLIDKIPKQS